MAKWWFGEIIIVLIAISEIMIMMRKISRNKIHFHDYFYAITRMISKKNPGLFLRNNAPLCNCFCFPPFVVPPCHQHQGGRVHGNFFVFLWFPQFSDVFCISMIFLFSDVYTWLWARKVKTPQQHWLNSRHVHWKICLITTNSIWNSLWIGQINKSVICTTLWSWHWYLVKNIKVKISS